MTKLTPEEMQRAVKFADLYLRGANSASNSVGQGSLCVALLESQEQIKHLEAQEITRAVCCAENEEKVERLEAYLNSAVAIANDFSESYFSQMEGMDEPEFGQLGFAASASKVIANKIAGLLKNEETSPVLKSRTVQDGQTAIPGKQTSNPLEFETLARQNDAQLAEINRLRDVLVKIKSAEMSTESIAELGFKNAFIRMVDERVTEALSLPAPTRDVGILVEALESLADNMPRCDCMDGHEIARSALQAWKGEK